jgi:hypothetical protein
LSVERPQDIALCQCGSVLIYTEHFRGKRWLCMTCGRLYASAPRMQTWTAIAEQRWRSLDREFHLNCGNHLICIGQMRVDCAQCIGPPEQEHIYHATERDWQLCNDALKWLSDRTGREFVFVNGELGHSGVTRPVTRDSFTDDILRGGL